MGGKPGALETDFPILSRLSADFAHSGFLVEFHKPAIQAQSIDSTVGLEEESESTSRRDH